MTANYRQIGHSHLFFRVFLNDRKSVNESFILTLSPDLLEKLMIDLINYLKMTRKQVLQKFDTPTFECFRQQGVVGIGHGFPGNIPGRIPVYLMLVNQKPHQFRHGNGGMSVIELYRGFIRKGAKV